MHITLFIVVSSFASLNKKAETLEVFMLSQYERELPASSKKEPSKSTKDIISRKLKVNEDIKKPDEPIEEKEKVTVLSDSSQVIAIESQGKSSLGSQNSKTGQGLETSNEKTIVDAEFGSASGPKLIYYEKPNYPPMARRLGKEGKVLLRLTIDEKGELIKIEVLESAPYGFTEAAIEALKKSKFAPAKKDGKPVASRALLPVKFVLTN